MRIIGPLLVSLILWAPFNAPAWEYESMAGVSATCIDDDPIHGRVFAGTYEGFHYHDIVSGEWIKRDEEGWIGRQVFAVGWHANLDQRVITGRENTFFKGYIKLYSCRNIDWGGILAGLPGAPSYYLVGVVTWDDHVIVSLDGGIQWLDITGDLAPAVPRDLAFSSFDESLYVVTETSGVFSRDLQTLISSTPEPPVARTAVRSALF
ncbi:MAG: hypothetical protein GF355_01100 [Candidatus Eisenbacteria bacterium]|nr:hypothetical protein [Candidatus Eisenbacteria bacterium]